MKKHTYLLTKTWATKKQKQQNKTDWKKKQQTENTLKEQIKT